MMSYSIKIKNADQIKAAFKAQPAKMASNLGKAITKAGILFRSRAEQKAPKKTGFLARTHQLKLSPFQAEIYPTAKYALFVHEGTKPHIISVKSAKVLTDGKGNFFGRSVFHPGQKAQPWIKWTIDDTEREIQGFFEKAVEDTLDNVARSA